MTGRYKAYPAYKSSGVEWLQELPNSWNVERTKRMLSLKHCVVGEDSVSYQLLSLTLQGVIPRDISSGQGKIPESFNTYQKVEENDLIFCLFDIDETPRTIGLSNFCGMITGAYNVYGCLDSCFHGYAYYYFLHIDSFKGLRPFYTGLRKVVRAETFSNIEMPCPSIEEQQKIVDFLDHETAKIDTLIAKQEKLIELLKEKRQAVISRAVTKGLNPNAPMKDSGVEWLGEVPEHWVVSKIKHISSLQSGIAKGRDLTDLEQIVVPMLRVANVQDGYLDLNNIHTIAIEPHQLTRYSLRYGDVLMNEGGDNDKLGRGAIWREQVIPCIHQNHVFAIRPHEVEPEWLDMITRSSYAKFYFYLVAKQSTNLASISSTNIKETPVCLPPKSERQEILNYLSIQLDKFHKLEQLCLNQIEVSKERKTALISAAVTGKIDVRDWQSEGLI